MAPADSSSVHSSGADEDLSGFGFDLPDDDWLGRVRRAGQPRVLGRVGEYELLGEIGQGAQGIVYRARQPHTAREVALKRLAAGAFATPSMRVRFEREVEAAAALHHPHIVTVYGMEFVDGQPLLAMEWVDGVPVDRWVAACSQATERRSDEATREEVPAWPGRPPTYVGVQDGRDAGKPVPQKPRLPVILRLFSKICAAVQHAHQRGVIHRDLKPGNILVDAAGEPRVLDFGLARLETAQSSSAVSLTHTHAFVGTPAYAAPEQLRGTWDAVDVRSDVYALGVILYQMLTGRLPHGRSNTLAELQEAVEHRNPDRPSALNPALDREIDAIVLRAVAPEQDHRYQTVDALRADVERYLAGEPVQAVPPGGLYPFRKWVHRHRLGFAFAATVSVLVIGFGIAATVLAVRLAKQGRAAMKARDQETEARETAEQINDFLQAMLASPDPARAGRDVTVREVLDEAACRVADGTFADRPAIEAAVRTTLGNTYRVLGHFPEAEPHLEAALDFSRQAHANGTGSAEDLAQSLSNLARLRHKQGDYPAAEALIRESLDLRVKRFGRQSEPVAESLNELGLMLTAQADYPAAEECLREAVDTLEHLYGADDVRVASALDTLGTLQQSAGDYAEAEKLLRRSLDIRRRRLGNEHPDVFTGLSNLALMLRMTGDLAGAEPLYLEAIALGRRLYGEDSPDVATTLSNWAVFLQTKGDLLAAEEAIREALDTRRKVLEPDHPEVARSLNNLAALLKARGRFDDAEAQYRESLEVYARSFPEDHPEPTTVRNNFAALLYSRKEYADSEALFRQVLETRRRTLPPDHPDLAISLNNLSAVLLEVGQYAEAEPLLREALDIQRRKLPPTHPNLASTLVNLGAAQLELEAATEAEISLTECLEIRRASMPGDHWLVVNPKLLLAAARGRQGRFDEAEPMLLESLAALQANSHVPATRLQAALRHVVRFYDDWQKPDRAETYRALLESPSDPG